MTIMTPSPNGDCVTCGGTGVVPLLTTTVRCEHCGGLGWVPSALATGSVCNAMLKYNSVLLKYHLAMSDEQIENARWMMWEAANPDLAVERGYWAGS